MAAMASRAQALPLITEEDGKYVVCDEAIELLEALPAPLAVVSIAGLWRTGKSYLLNHLSGANCEGKGGGFTVGATVNACTKGLWLWGEPVKLEDGLTVVFIDTEGLGSTSRTQTEDSQIFSLALLLSSLFVWNSRGVIDGNALEDFALVVNLTKHIHVRSNAASKAVAAADAKGTERRKSYVAGSAGGSGGGAAGGPGHELDELSAHFPGFMWVVRDFTLRLEDGGRKINDRQYLENALKPQQSFTSEAASRNQIRTLLSSFFRERDCCTLVRPAEDEDTLRNLSNVPLRQLRPEFQTGLADLKSKVYAQTRAKAVNGRALSGAMLGTLASTYAEALNSGGVPTISTAWDRVLQSQAAEAVEKALKRYDESAASELKLPDPAVLGARLAPRPDDDDGGDETLKAILDAGALPLENADVRASHETRVAAAEAEYAKAVWTDESQRTSETSRDQLAKLDEALGGRLARLLDVNAQCSTLRCGRAADAACARFEATLKSKLATAGGGKESYADVLSARLAKLDTDADAAAARAAFGSDLAARKAWLEAFPAACGALQDAYAKDARGPSAGDVYADAVAPRILNAALGWATTLGVEHRAVQKLARAACARAEEARQQAAGRLAASTSAADRERQALERAAEQADTDARARIASLEALVAARRVELERHEAGQKRLEDAFQYASELLDRQTDLARELGDDARGGLARIRNRVEEVVADAGAMAAAEADAAWDAHDLGFERDELAEFAPLRLPALKERIAEDEKELELMHEHAALTIEHAKVKKMLLADKDHELQEYEYQWGVAKANVAASEGELMVVDEEVAVLRGLVLQMHKHLVDASRSGRFPADVARSLPRDQKALLEQLLDGR
mmetsp:Transcript_17968/g.55276  ORF Transcript_17968/g.55276 Transcript_17968/m.55276 type:complete len:863 (-) Transcript_17968:32-2620(-)